MVRSCSAIVAFPIGNWQMALAAPSHRCDLGMRTLRQWHGRRSPSNRGSTFGWTTESIQEYHFQHEYLQEDKPHSAARPMLRLRKVGGVDPVLVRAAKNSGDADSSGQLLGEASPGTAGTIASVAVFTEGDLVGAGVAAAPLCPAC